MYRKEIRLTKQEATERIFKCAHCGARGEVMFQATGTSGWVRENQSRDQSYDLHRAADRNLSDDAMRVLALIHCPTCGQRAPRAMFWLRVRCAFMFVVAALVVIIGGRQGGEVALFCAGVGGYAVWKAVGRLKRARAAVVTKLVPGKLPEPPKPVMKKPVERPAPKPMLPEARAIAVPPVTPPKPVEPGDQPTFLR